MTAAVKLFVPEISGLLAALLTDSRASVSLPGFYRYCSRASAAGMPPQDPYSAVVADLGLAQVAGAPFPHAACCRHARGCQPTEDTWLNLSPVHYTSASSGLILRPIERGQLPQEDCDQLTELLQKVAADGKFRVEPDGQGSWHVNAEQQPDLRTVPLYEVRDRPVALHLPAGEDAVFWTRWLAECEMILHDHALNKHREKRGLPEVSGFWLWGEGQLPDAAAANCSCQLLTSDAALRGMALRHGCATADFSLPELDNNLGSSVAADFALITSHGEADDLMQWLSGLEENWMQPAMKMLARGELSSLQLIDPVAGAAWRLQRLDLKKFWRSRPVFPGQT